LGRGILSDLGNLDIVFLEKSREMPLKLYPNQKVKKSLRSYHIEPKVRFKIPFLRFWFGFVAPFERDLENGRADRFINNFENGFPRLNSFMIELLSHELLNKYFQ